MRLAAALIAALFVTPVCAKLPPPTEEDKAKAAEAAAKTAWSDKVDLQPMGERTGRRIRATARPMTKRSRSCIMRSVGRRLVVPKKGRRVSQAGRFFGLSEAPADGAAEAIKER